MRVWLVKQPTWTCCCSQAPLEGMRDAKEEGKEVREGNKMRGRVETAARSTCQQTLETELRRQMLRRLASRRPAKRTELTNHFSLSRCEQRTRAHREIKILHNASTQQIENRGGGSWVCICDSDIYRSWKSEKETPPGRWQLCQIASGLPLWGREVSGPTRGLTSDSEGWDGRIYLPANRSVTCLFNCCAERAEPCLKKEIQAIF